MSLSSVKQATEQTHVLLAERGVLLEPVLKPLLANTGFCTGRLPILVLSKGCEQAVLIHHEPTLISGPDLHCHLFINEEMLEAPCPEGYASPAQNGVLLQDRANVLGQGVPALLVADSSRFQYEPGRAYANPACCVEPGRFLHVLSIPFLAKVDKLSQVCDDRDRT